MIEFQAPTPADKAWVDELLALGNLRGCDYNFTNLFVWQKAYRFELARMGNFLLIRLRGRTGNSYMYPAGSGDIAAAVRALEADAAERGEPLRLVCLTPPQMAELEEFFPGRFTCTADRDGYDYLYDIDRLADLGGKKLHAKRNHIHRFDEQFPDWMFEPITPANIPECLDLERAWSARREESEPESGEETLSEETIAVIEALYQMDPLALEGGLIRAGGKPVAFSLGSLTTPACFDVHFEKAAGEIQGAYAVINREMARMVRDRHPQVKWLNREDDLGLEGLRKAKLSYYPDILLEKFTAREV